MLNTLAYSRLAPCALCFALALGSFTSRTLGSPLLNEPPAAGEAADALKRIIAAATLEELTWPNFSDYRADVGAFYEAGGYRAAWSRDGQPTPQAQAIIAVLRQAEESGLSPEDYDASRWRQRLQLLGQPVAAARFDAALTVCVMRYILDLHIGRVNPNQLHAGLAERNSRYDLAQFVRARLIDSADVPAQLEAVEPQFPGYKRTLRALRDYLKLSKHALGEPLPVPAKPLDAGDRYPQVGRLAERLRLLGDLGADAAGPEGDLYQPALVAAVKHFQSRHGLAPDGRLGS